MKKIIAFFLIISSYCLGNNYTIVDAHGKTHSYNKTFSRIISLYPAHTEIISELGASKALIGVSRELGVETPEGVTEFNLGDSIEKFIALQPDLVLVRPMVENKYSTMISTLRSRGVEVISLHPKTSSELSEYWLSLGRLTGNEEEAVKYIENFEERMSKLRKRTQVNKRIFFEARYNRSIYTSSSDSIASYVLESTGVDNIFRDKKSTNSTIVPIRQEELLSRGNDIDVYIAQRGTMNNRNLTDIKNTNGYNLIKAVRDNKIMILNENIMSRPTSKILDAVEDIIEYLEMIEKK